MGIDGVEAGTEDLRHVYWIGGGPGAGKSTTARRLAEHYGLHLYDTDDLMSDHFHRTTPEQSPFLSRFAAMDMDERWLNRSPRTMLDTFHWFRGEGFGLIVEDLLRLRGGIPVVAEGFRLLPDLVAPLLAVPHQAVWLLPSPEFRVAALESRGSTWTIAGRTSVPERALANLAERDRMFTDRLTEQTRRLGLQAIRLEPGKVSEDQLFEQVARIFKLRPA
jgi:2-phosphoglycerate kinase